MLSLSGVSKSVSYYEKEDYYFKDKVGEVVLGQELVGEKLTKEQFEKLVNERIEETKGKGNNQKEDKIAEDLTFSAPKSVSLVAALDQEAREKIFNAHQEAVQAVMNYIENSNMIQTRENGKPALATEAIAAKFDHFTSRNGDPQLHSHVLLLNRVMNENKELRATYLREIYENKIALGTMYRQELASNLEKFGYSVEWRKDGTFELKGFSEEQLRAFSTRRQEIEKALQEKGLEGGKAAEVAALDTREAKKEYNIKELEESWRKTAKELNIQVPQPQQQEQKQDKIQETIKNTDLMNITQEVVTKQIETTGFTQQMRVELELTKALAKEGITTNINQIRELAQQALGYMHERDNGLVELGTDKFGRDYYTTNDVLNAEMRAREKTSEREALNVQKTEEILNKFNEHLEKTKGFKLDDYQTQAIAKIATSNRDSIVVGKAGSGKTTMMQALRDVYEKQGKEVIGLAPTGAAARNLQKEAKIESFTIDALTFKDQKFEKMQEQLKGGLIIIDEAGMLDARRSAAAVEFAEKYNMKVLYVGDPDQIKPVGHGDPFAQKVQEELKKDSKNLIVLDKIYRQKDEKYREVALLAATNKTQEALEKAKQYGWVREITARGERIQQAAKEYLQDVKEGKNTLLVTESNALKDKLNKEIRYILQKEGILQKENEIKLETRGTDGKKIGEREFTKNDVIQFLKNDKKLGVMNGQRGIIQNIDVEKNIMVVKVNDEIKNINYSKYNYIDHGYATTIHKSQGQTVDKVIYVNDTKKSKMTNSNLFYVAISRGREAVTIYTDNVEKLQEKIQNAQEKKDVLGWKVKHEQKQQKDSKINENNVIDQNKYAEFRAQEKIKQAINESATRLTWYDMNMQQKRDFVSSVLERQQQQMKEGKQTQQTIEQQKTEELKEKIEEKANNLINKLELNNLTKDERKEITQNVMQKLNRDVTQNNLKTYFKQYNKQTYNKTYNKSNNIFSFLGGNYYQKKYYEALKTNENVKTWAFFAGKTAGDIRKDKKAFELAKSDRSMFEISFLHANVAKKVKNIRASYAVKSGDVWKAWQYGGADKAIDAAVNKIVDKTIDKTVNAVKDTAKNIFNKLVDKIDEIDRKRQIEKLERQQHEKIDKHDIKQHDIREKEEIEKDKTTEEERQKAAKEIREEIKTIKEERQQDNKEKIEEKLNKVDEKIDKLKTSEQTKEETKAVKEEIKVKDEWDKKVEKAYREAGLEKGTTTETQQTQETEQQQTQQQEQQQGLEMGR